MNAPASITITPVRVADLLAEGERVPVYVQHREPVRKSARRSLRR